MMHPFSAFALCRHLYIAAAMCLALSASGLCTAQTRQTTDAQREQAAQAAKAGIPESELVANAPARYTIKRGDTLWAISSLYLKSPWKWPSLWGMNQSEISNPHLIYPGQVLVLTRSGGMAKLGLANGLEGLPEQKLLAPPSEAALPDQKLLPRVRSEPLLPSAIPSIQLGMLKHFLSQPLVVDNDIVQNSGYVLTGPENRVFTAKGDTFYARGLAPSADNIYQMYRPGKPLHDPDTGALLAYEAFYLGSAQVVRAGDPTQLKIMESKEEVSRSDRLTPNVREPDLYAVPRAPAKAIRARVMSSYNGVEHAGNHMIVTLNKGRNEGLEIGHVLSVWRKGDRVVDLDNAPKGFWAQLTGEKTIVQLPDEQYGRLLVFRVFEKVAYALVMEATSPVKLGDSVTEP